MANYPLTSVAKADVIERIVARCIASKTWRSACEIEALAYAFKVERKAVLEYIKAEYTIAGANFQGRWSWRNASTSRSRTGRTSAVIQRRIESS